MPSSIKDVEKRHETRLLQLPGVVSVGIGLNRNGESAIIIGLDAPNADNVKYLSHNFMGH